MAKSKSRLRRLATLGGLTSRVSSSYLGQRLKGAFQTDEENDAALEALHLENASRVANTMSQIKGAAMKVGQSLALLADSMDLSPELAQIFSKLNDQAQPISFEEIRSVIEREVGNIDEHFLSIDPEPLGTASLAQAHAAQLKNGRSVVVKVLHEGVEFSVDTDLTALKSILLAGKFFRRPKEEIDMVFAEIKERLLEELDYENELRNIEFFEKAFRNIEGVTVPKPVTELCGKRVLTMSRITGTNLDRFLETATPEAKHKAGKVLVDVFHEMVYVHHRLHADPHGGNFLFQTDGSVGLIDFGCVKNFTADFIRDYALLSNYLVDNEKEQMISMARKMMMLRDDNPEAADVLWEFSNILARPFRVGRYTAGVAEDSLMDDIRGFGSKILKYPSIRSPRDLIFLHRSLTGIYAMLRRLNYTCNYDEVRRRYANMAIAKTQETENVE
jgi:predicted unusual protein kinase regulating ubiquinone biosynthesis (AarF/ABC1/UbiB family)